MRHKHPNNNNKNNMQYFNRLLSWYFGKEAIPYWCILLVDCIILVVFYNVGYYCINGAGGLVQYFWERSFILMGCMVFYLVGFKLFHTYTNVVRYSSFIDLRNVLYANIFGALCMMVMRLFTFEGHKDIFPGIRVIFVAFCLSTFAMFSWRILVKVLFDVVNVNTKTNRAYVYGTYSVGVSIAKSIRNQKPAKFTLKGFISPDDEPQSKYLLGVPIHKYDLNLVPHMLHDNISAVLVSPTFLEKFRDNDRLVNDLTESGIKIYFVPEAQEWDGKAPLQDHQLRKVDIEDLLPREKIDVDMDSIGKLLRGKKILITGAAGSIGSEMVRQIATFGPSGMILIDQAETPMHDVRLYMANKHPEVNCETIVTSISNASRMEKIFSAYKPEYVFHAAAYKHVPMMEDNPSEAVQNNVYGTRVIADMAVKYGTKKFVMISTDKAVNPTNVMGCSKRICEIYCQSLNAAIKEGKVNGVTQFVTTRFGNVLGSNGSVIPLFREQIKKGGPVTVTHPDIVRFFMLIPEACKLVLQAGTFGHGGEIFVFDMGKAVRIADLAKRMIALSRAKNIEIKYTGLREGEKLFEEVLSDAEQTVPTDHPKIRIAKVRQYPYEEALSNETRLYDASFNYDDMDTVRIMKEIVPEFKSRHSKYESLDT